MPDPGAEKNFWTRVSIWMAGRPFLGWYIAAVVTANLIWTVWQY